MPRLFSEGFFKGLEVSETQNLLSSGELKKLWSNDA